MMMIINVIVVVLYTAHQCHAIYICAPTTGTHPYLISITIMLYINDMN